MIQWQKEVAVGNVGKEGRKQWTCHAIWDLTRFFRDDALNPKITLRRRVHSQQRTGSALGPFMYCALSIQ